jgi:Asp-tRNA(Asn)/Glu-tRNA(Gln) amidotransferase A subunit family amidase
MNRDEITSLPAAEAARAIAAGELLSEEMVEACLQVIDARDGDVQAWQTLDRNHALEQARARDDLRRSGRLSGPLQGVPVAIKDNVDTEDLPTEDGTVLHAGRRPLKDATLVSRLRSAGAVILGKTVTTEFAYFTPGKTRNPHAAAHTPGGSSSGSAAAVAAGMVPLAVGTQTNGSVIRPASFCGVVGYKPSFGVISRNGVLRTSRSLDQVGVFARSVRDAALIAQCLAGYDPEDEDTVHASWQQLAAMAVSEPPLDPAFGLLRSKLWDQAAADTLAGFDELSEELGSGIQRFDLGEVAVDINGAHQTIMRAEMAFSLGGEYRRGKERMSPRLVELIESGMEVGAVQYQQARQVAQRLHEEVEALFDSCDVMMLPAAIGTAPAGLESTGDPLFCSMASLFGMPAISLPLLVGENGLPIGVQLVGRRFDDARLLRAANWLVTRLASARD